jgi:hypothetical protein
MTGPGDWSHQALSRFYRSERVNRKSPRNQKFQGLFVRSPEIPATRAIRPLAYAVLIAI